MPRTIRQGSLYEWWWNSRRLHRRFGFTLMESYGSQPKHWLLGRVCAITGHPWEQKMSGRLCRRCRTFEAR